jgi:hypothetical protein
MLKLIAATEEQIDNRTVAKRISHHLTHGWVVNQNWKIRVALADGTPTDVDGDAQVVVQGLYSAPSCAAVVRVGSAVEVVLCRGVVDALERLGFLRADIEVV